MGADLYLASLFAKHHAKWEKRFERAVAERDRLTEGTPEFERAQKRVNAAYERMYARGYFRDSYNPSNLLWQFGLSWWTDVSALVDTKEGLLTPEKAETLLRMLEERESVFEGGLASKPTPTQRYFRAKYRTLRAFLETAVRRNEPIECSI
jgi:hypothetical protein